jgi:pimeloyl-ACP methyl ester carboxylesterase
LDFDACYDRIERAGGAEARAAAEQVFTVGDAESYVAFDRLVAPLFVSTSARNPWSAHAIRTYDVVGKFHRPPRGEIHTMDFRKDLAKVQCPTLVLTGGSGDLITPPEVARDMANCLPQELTRFECLAHGRHGVFRDDPEATDRIIRSFIADVRQREAASRRPE